MTSESNSPDLGFSPVSRRCFLSQAALATAPLFTGLVLTSRGEARAASPADRIRVGLIGSGGMGGGDLATFFQFEEVDCPVVCDVDDARAAQVADMVEKKRGRKPDAVKDFRRVIERKDVDAVIVATPDHWHALPTVLACQAGKDVYVEKPLATTIAEGRAMLTAAQKHNRVVQMGSQWRSCKHMVEAGEFVRSGKIGKVGMVRGWTYLDWLQSIGHKPDAAAPAGVDYDLWLGPAPKRPFNPNRFHFNFRWFWDYAGGLMTDWGVHLINMMFLGLAMEPPKTVSSSGGKYVFDDDSETPDSQVAVYEFPSYMLIWEHKAGLGVGINGRPWGVSWSGTEGTVIMNDSGWEVLMEKRKGSLDPFKKPGGGDPRPPHIRNFLDCVKSRQQPIENLEVGHFLSTLAHLGNIAQRVNRKLNWDAKAEKIVGDHEANRLATVQYRRPWKLPYLPA